MKILRITLAILAVLLGMSAYAIPRLFFGLSWLKGWPEFLSFALPYAIGLSLALVIIKPLGKNEKKQSKLRYLIFAALLVLQIAVHFENSVVSYHRVETIHSPGGTNTAVVMMRRDRSFCEAYPVIARFFFEDETRVYLSSAREDWTYTWLDENTLEFIHNHIVTGEETEDYLRW